jgi:hypothetical protein
MDSNFHTHNSYVVLTASLELASGMGSYVKVKLQPLKFDRPYRLSRRFGSDRFLEILLPSLDSSKAPASFRNLGEWGIERFRQWILHGPHHFLGRTWAPFFVRPEKGKAIKSTKTEGLGSDPKQAPENRLFLFAENGDDFHPATLGRFPAKSEDVDSRTVLAREGLLDWLLQTANNTDEPYLKLFSRIALGMTVLFVRRTVPVLILHRP